MQLPDCCMEQEGNVISFEPWKGEEGNWRTWAIFRSESLACYWHPSGWYAGGVALAGVLTQSDWSKKTWLWSHSGPTSPGTGSVHRQHLPGLLLWQTNQSMEEAGGSCLYFVWQLSQLSVAWEKRRQGQQQNMVDLSSSGLANSKHTASPSYHSPWFQASTGICATWDWNSPSRTGLSSSHCGILAFMNSGSHPEHKMSQFDNSRHTRQ
jgi:hypothetical protein